MPLRSLLALISCLAAVCATPHVLPAQATGEAPAALAASPWFAATHADLGVGSGVVRGTLEFRNPQGHAVVWRGLTGNCACSKATVHVGGGRYELRHQPVANQLVRIEPPAEGPEQVVPVAEIPIPAGAAGRVEVELNLNGIVGTKQALLDIHTDDPAMPHARLTFAATAAARFQVSPPEVPLGSMRWDETRAFEVTVVADAVDWRILRMEDVPAGKATWTRSTVDGRTAWTIHGSYGPLTAQQAGATQWTFHTDLDGGATFEVRLLAEVVQPISVRPGKFLGLGLVAPGAVVEREFTLAASDGKDLRATSVGFASLSLPASAATATIRQDGAQVVVTVRITAPSSRGRVQGDVVVALDHPVVPEQRIPFQGFVR